MTVAWAASVRSLLAARLDMSIPGCSIAEVDMPVIRRNPRLRYCHAGYNTDACSASRSQKSEPGCPGSRAHPIGDWIGTRMKSRRRHQHGVDHMDHAVRLVDVRDRHRRRAALGVHDG